MTLITFLLLGLGNGAVFAALGVSLAISYRTSNVVNFGVGSMALFGAVIYETVHTQQAIFNPFAAASVLVYIFVVIAVVVLAIRWVRPGRPPLWRMALTAAVVAGIAFLGFQPTLLDIGTNLSTAVALVVACAFSALFGYALYAVVFRRLRDALPLTRVVAAIGVLLFFPALVVNRLGGANAINVPQIFPSNTWHLGQIIIEENAVCVAGVVVAVAVVLGLVYRKTRFGLMTTTAAETETGATVLGIRPNLIGGVNWAIGGAVAGVFGALVASFVPTSPDDFALFVVSGLAAAMIGGMSSLWWATVAGLAIGMLQSELQYLATRYRFLPQQGITDLVPLVLLVVVMLVRSKALPERGTLIRRSLPTARPPRHVWQWTSVLTVVGVVLALTLQGNYLVALATSLIGMLLALSLIVLTGFVGQISLAQYMFAGVSAFLLSRFTENWGVPFPIAPILSALVVSIFGLLLALPAVRVRGVNLAILSLSVGLAVQDIYFTNATYVGGGGSPTAKPPSLLGFSLSIGTHGYYPRFEFPLMVMVVLIPIGLAVVGIRRSSLGLQMLAVRANERAAAANGINVARVKIVAFMISSFIAGLAGSFLAYFNYGGFSAASFDIMISVTMVALVFISGISMVSGAVLAGISFAGGLWAVLLQNVVPSFTGWYAVFAGLSLLLTALTIPEGIAGHLADGGPLTLWRTARARRQTAATMAPRPAVNGGVQDGVAIDSLSLQHPVSEAR